MLQLFRLYAERHQTVPFQFMPGADAARALGGTPLTDRLRTYDADIVIAPDGDRRARSTAVP